MKNFLYAKFECLVEIEGKTFKLLPNELLMFEENDNIKIFPMEENLLPLCFHGKNFTMSKYLICTEFPKYNLVEIITPKLFVGKYFFSKKLKDGTVNIIGEPYTVICNLKEKNYEYELKNDITINYINEVKNCIIIEFLRKNDDFFLIFHKKSHIFQEFSGNFEIIDNKIKILEDRHTLARHGKLYTYLLDDSTLKEVSCETVYLNHSPKICPTFLFHIAFFEAIKEKDFMLAKTYLTETFAKKITPKHFEIFFGDFDYIKPIKENGVNKVALISQISDKSFKAKVFTVSFNGQLINDISED